MFAHCNQQAVYERLVAIRDGLGGLTVEQALEPATAHRIGSLFAGDMTLFRFLDEQPGHFLVIGRPPAEERGGAGRYYDGNGREGWHRVLRNLRNDSDVFWAGIQNEPLPPTPHTLP
jgi:hypothetical protein